MRSVWREVDSQYNIAHLWHEKQLVIVSDVPAGTCEQCGQSHVDPDVSARLEQYLQNCDTCRPQRYIQVPEFSAAQILDADL